MARFGDDKIEEVRTRADIVEIIGAHVRLRRAGRNFVGLCPFHNEKTPSFSVNAERGFFHCFGCGAGGTVFNFMMRIEGLTFPEAMRSLARRYGVTLPERRSIGTGGGRARCAARANQTAAEFFAHVLWKTDDGALARDYLKSRGISVETARAFMLGFAPARPASLAKALEKRGLPDARRQSRAGQARRRRRVRHVSRAADVPDSRRAGPRDRIRRPRARRAAAEVYQLARIAALLEDARRSMDCIEARQAIASRSDRAIVVEGYFDVIALWQAGFKEDGRELRHRADGRSIAAALALYAQRFRVLRRRRGRAQGVVAGAGDFSAGGIARARHFHSRPASIPIPGARARRAGVRGVDRLSRVAGRLFSQRTGGARRADSLSGRARAAERSPRF